MHGETLKRVLN